MRGKDQRLVNDIVDGKIAQLKKSLKDEFAHIDFRFNDIVWPAQAEIEHLKTRMANAESVCKVMAELLCYKQKAKRGKRKKSK